MAARGTREANGGEERILERAEREAVRRRAWRIQVRAVLIAALGVGVALSLRFLVARVG